MNLFPGAIVLLFSLGALLNGLMPGPSVVPDVEPLEPALLEQMRDKISVQMVTPEPLTVTLSESDTRRAADMLRQGLSVADAARAVYPAYDTLSEAEKRWFEAAVARSLTETKEAQGS